MAAVLHAPGDLRVEEVPVPRDGEILVRVEASTCCGTDRKALLHGHRILGPYPCRFGHETAGVREDTGERVLVGDSVACGACAACRAGRAQLCRELRWVVGGFAQWIAAPEAALHAVPGGLDAAGAAMAEPLAAAVHAVGRAADVPAAEAAVVGDRHLLDAQVARRVEDRGHHGSTTALSASPERASSSARPVSARPRRWVTQGRGSTPPPASSATAARMSAGPADQLVSTVSSRRNCSDQSIGSGVPGAGGVA